MCSTAFVDVIKTALLSADYFADNIHNFAELVPPGNISITMPVGHILLCFCQ